jgi:hypothetical protein
MRLGSLVFVTAVVAGCNHHENVQCTENADCNLSAGGLCLATPPSEHQWCAYPDTVCTSGYRYSNDDTGDGVGGSCVPGGAGVIYTLSVSVGGSGAGSVVSTPGGLTCSSGTCTGTFPAGEKVELTATATSGAFLGWANDCSGATSCIVTMSTDRGVGALFGVPGQALWLRDIGGTSGSGLGGALAMDGQGNLISAAAFSGTVQIGTTTLVSAGKSDLLVAKISSQTGDVLWAKQFGGTRDDSADGVAVDAAGAIYVVGRYESPSIDFGGGPLDSVGFRSGFLVKLAADGSHVWSRSLRSSGSANDSAYALGVSVNATGVATTGYYSGAMTIGGTTLTSAGSGDIFAAKFTTDGTAAWAKSFGGSNLDFGRSVAIDSGGNVVVAGSFGGSLMFPTGTLDAGSGSAVLLLKLASADGAPVVAKRFGSTTESSEAFAVAVDGSDNIFIAGSFWGTGDFGGTTPLTAIKQQDAFLGKYSAAGAYLWAKSFGGTGDGESVRSMSVNTGGDVAITGGFCGAISFGGAMLSAASQCPSSGNANHGNDMFAVHFAGVDGAHVASFRGGGALDDGGMGIVLAGDGRLFVAGWFQTFAEFGGSTLTALSPSMATDGFLVGLPPH